MTMHTQFGELDLDDLIDEDPPPSTKRMPGSATFDVEDKMTALFVSATWQLIATVKDKQGDTIIAQSTEMPKAHSDAFMKRWARQVIRSNQKKLRKMGVDVEATYLRWGGILDDLEETG
jgi:hypothetical protein